MRCFMTCAPAHVMIYRWLKFKPLFYIVQFAKLRTKNQFNIALILTDRIPSLRFSRVCLKQQIAYNTILDCCTVHWSNLNKKVQMYSHWLSEGECQRLTRQWSDAPTFSITALARERERVSQPQLFSPSCLSRPSGHWPVQAAWRE